VLCFEKQTAFSHKGECYCFSCLGTRPLQITQSEVATRAVYSFHKTSTRSFVLKQLVEKMGCTSATVVAEMRFDIPRSYEFHNRDSVDVAVDLIRVDLTAAATTAVDDEPPVQPS
jgi:predicted RNA methylase